MAPANPCCSCDVKIGVIVMTVVYVVYSAIEICVDPFLLAVSKDKDFLGWIVLFALVIPYPNLWMLLLVEQRDYTKFLIVVLAVDLLTLVISVLTFIAALTKAQLLLRVWYLIVPTHLAFAVALIVLGVRETIYGPITILLLMLILKAYEVWVAQALINQISAEERGEIPPRNAQGFNQLQPVQYAYPQPYPVIGEQPPPPYYQQQDQQSQQYFQQNQQQQPQQYFQQGQQQQPQQYLPQGQQPPQYFQQGQQPPQYFLQGQQPPPPPYIPNPPPQLPKA